MGGKKNCPELKLMAYFDFFSFNSDANWNLAITGFLEAG